LTAPVDSPRGARKIETRAVSALVPYARNARLHSEGQIEKIAASIKQFGFNNPVLVDENGGIIAGHGRVLGAKLAGLTEVPVVPLGHLSEAERRAYVIADNRIAEDATWDDALLQEELAAIDLAGLDLLLTGFNTDELDQLLHGDSRGAREGEDDAPALGANPVTRHGDLWALGAHRVLCGDATSAQDVERALGAVRPHLMVTDPPYGVNYNPTWRDDAGGVFGDGKTKMRGSVANDDRVDWRAAWILFPGDVAYVWHASLKAVEAAASLDACGFEMKAQIIWRKQHFTLMRQGYHWQHEPCWYAVRKNARAGWTGDRKQTSIWDIQSLNPAGGNRAEEKTGHGTQKPVECMRRPIVNNSSPGQAVYDPFLGSGTTIIAAETEGRSCLGLEIDPAYCDVIVKRWQEFTGKAATLEGDGRTFAEVAAERKLDEAA
jgi:DNA modification methylase